MGYMNINKENIGLIIGIVLIVLAVIIFLIVLYAKSKKLKVSSVYFISGAVKTGKSALSVFIALKEYSKSVFAYYVKLLLLYELKYLTLNKFSIFAKTISESKKPMLYTNMPLRYIRFNRLTLDILLRKVRLPNKSIVLIDESSLIADSMHFKDKNVNNTLLLFFKLFGHYTHGGKCILNSQSWSDNHFAVKRTMSRYTYIYENRRFPFISAFKVREMFYSEDNSQLNVATNDIEKSGFLYVLVPNFLFKLYDRYYLSVFTDDLAYQVDYKQKRLGRKSSLKVSELVTLQSFKDKLVIKENNNETQQV